MFFKRQLPVIIMVSIGILTLLAHFIKIESIGTWVEEDSLLWFDIIAAFAIFLGAFNLLKMHFSKIVKQKSDFQYSFILILGFFLMIFSGFFYHGTETIGNESWDKGEKFIDINNNEIWDEGEEFKDGVWGDHIKHPDSLFSWMFNSLFYPLDATMFALLAFFVASASYRAFRIRNFEASLLLTAGVLVMIGAVPIGAYIPSWMFVFILLSLLFAFISPLFKSKDILIKAFLASCILLGISMFFWDPAFLNSKSILFWIIAYPTVAGKKAIMIGVALGIVATSLRIIFGKDKSFLGE